uniref:Plant-type ferredoxin n=1 Tax=Diaphorobacter sp. PCA039 TaxID=266831 RepID=C0KGM1_9BURK|nr:plant-type ferredoxin [Diaphorobacter sp. PCA039]
MRHDSTQPAASSSVLTCGAAHHAAHVLALQDLHLAHTAAALSATHGNAFFAQRFHALQHGAHAGAGVLFTGVFNGNDKFLHGGVPLSRRWCEKHATASHAATIERHFNTVQYRFCLF